jgi:hypothetical protein
MPQEYLTMPVFEFIPSVRRLRGGMRPLSVGRVESAFRPAMIHHDEISILCEVIAAMTAMMVNQRSLPPALIALAVRGSP